jgi:hypothetical protein
VRIVTVGGSINSADISFVKSRLGTALPYEQYATFTLTNVNDSAGEHSDNVSSPDMGFLIGDVNASGRVDSADRFVHLPGRY